MENFNQNPTREDDTLLPVHTRRIGIVMLWFLAYSLAMFTLPFIAFFYVRHVLNDTFHIDGFTNTVWSIVAAVVTVNIIILAYAYRAYHEPEYDEDGNLIDQSAPISKKQD